MICEDLAYSSSDLHRCMFKILSHVEFLTLYSSFRLFIAKHTHSFEDGKTLKNRIIFVFAKSKEDLAHF